MTDTQSGAGGKAADIRALGKSIFVVQDPAPPQAHRFEPQRERPYTGIVAAAGPLAIKEGGVEVGDRISFRRGTYQSKVFSGQEYLLLSPGDLEAVIPHDEQVDTPYILPDGVSLDNMHLEDDGQATYIQSGVNGENERLAIAVTGKANPEIFHFGQNL